MRSERDLEGRVAIVTGAGKGLGRAYAHELARRGAALVVNNRLSDPAAPSSAEALAEELRAAGGRAIADTAAAEDPHSGAQMTARALETFGRLDAIVANAGVPETMRLHRQSPDGFRRIFEINFFGTLHLLHAGWGALCASGAGRVVVSASSAGLHGGDGMAAYASSKAALIGLMRALALEGRPRGVCVNAIAPYAATAMTSTHLGAGLAERMPPEAVAPLVAWLVSAACDVAGETFVVGGGKLRAARAVEGGIIDMRTGDVGAAAHRALAAGPLEAFPDSHSAFAAFMAG